MDRNEIVCGDMDWDHLATDGDKCRAVVSMATDLLVPQNAANFLSSSWLVASQEDSAP